MGSKSKYTPLKTEKERGGFLFSQNSPGILERRAAEGNKGGDRGERAGYPIWMVVHFIWETGWRSAKLE